LPGFQLTFITDYNREGEYIKEFRVYIRDICRKNIQPTFTGDPVRINLAAFPIPEYPFSHRGQGLQELYHIPVPCPAYPEDVDTVNLVEIYIFSVKFIIEHMVEKRNDTD